MRVVIATALLLGVASAANMACEFSSDCFDPFAPPSCIADVCVAGKCKPANTIPKSKLKSLSDCGEMPFRFGGMGDMGNYKIYNEHAFTHKMGNKLRVWALIVNTHANDKTMKAIDMEFEMLPGPLGGVFGTKRADWMFWKYIHGRILVLSGDDAGDTHSLIHKAGAPAYQVGHGANTLNDNIGSRGSFQWRTKGQNTWNSLDVYLDVNHCELPCRANTDCVSRHTGATCYPLECVYDEQPAAAARRLQVAPGLCGWQNENTPCPIEGDCCSEHGYCGDTADHCNNFCQFTYSHADSSCVDNGNPTNPPVTAGPALCGIQNDNVKCANGECCSEYGYCGDSVDHCAVGCQFTYSATGSSCVDNGGPVTPGPALCGSQNNNVQCANGECCSEYGYCGDSEDHCAPGCQFPYSAAGSACQDDGGVVPGPATCGASNNGLKCANGECCSEYGYCGSDPEYCVPGCQFAYSAAGSACVDSGPPAPSVCGTQNDNVKCGNNDCCSEYGYCGDSEAHCATGCQFAYSADGSTCEETDPVEEKVYVCGVQNGETSCTNGECCSEYGYCGSDPEFCTSTCQWAYSADGSSCVSPVTSVRPSPSAAPHAPECGDGQCNGDETCATCSKDCGPCQVCGNQMCDRDETCATCPMDCGKCPTCGDYDCNGLETCETCEDDCGKCNGDYGPHPPYDRIGHCEVSMDAQRVYRATDSKCVWLHTSKTSPIGPYKSFRWTNGDYGYIKDDGDKLVIWGYIENYKNSVTEKMATGKDYKLLEVNFEFEKTTKGRTVGNPKPDWRYFKLKYAHMRIVKGSNAGTTLHVRTKPNGPMLQIGTGAAVLGDLKKYGLSWWFQWRMKNGQWLGADINLNIEGECKGKCGDGYCAADSETCDSCPSDCGDCKVERCGPGAGGDVCVDGECCSSTGWCGTATSNCGPGCQPLFGHCDEEECGNGFCGEGETCQSCSEDCVCPVDTCGPNYGGQHCSNDKCCSSDGTCGSDLHHCGIGCQEPFGMCHPPADKCGDGMCGDSENCETCPDDCHCDVINCGPNYGNAVCENDQCCSKHGWCGDDEDFCGLGCLEDYGRCNDIQEECGNGKCVHQAGETCQTCAQDCGECAQACDRNTDCTMEGAECAARTCDWTQGADDAWVRQCGPVNDWILKAFAANAYHAMHVNGANANSPLGKYSKYKFVDHHGHFIYDPDTDESWAHLWGYLENYKSPAQNKKATGDEYKKLKVDVVFKGSPENKPQNGVKKGGGSPQADWRYYTLEAGRLEVVVGTNVGDVIVIKQKTGTPLMQIGSGANDKNKHYGLSTWFLWQVEGGTGWQSGDFNLRIEECEDDGCGDNVCDADAGETCETCPTDCGECDTVTNCGPDYGKKSCTDGECCSKTGWCGDTAAHCSPVNDCQKQYGACWDGCGDGVCDENNGESCENCVADCGECPDIVCGNGICDLPWAKNGETCGNCPHDCGPCTSGSAITKCVNNKEILMTFGGGPNGQITKDLTLILKEKAVTASFALVGSAVSAGSDAVKLAHGLGFSIASNTYSHPNLVQLTDAQAYHELTKAVAAIREEICYEPNIVQPPSGRINTAKRYLMYHMGNRPLLWNVNPYDKRDAEKKPNDVIAAFRSDLSKLKGKGAISLQHDFSKDTIALVPELVKIAHDSGYKFVDQDQCVYGDNADWHPSQIWANRFCYNGAPMVKPNGDCPVSMWSTWSANSADCGPGTQTRVRYTIPYGLETVIPECAATQLIQIRTATRKGREKCHDKCDFSAWSEWGECSKECSGGTRSRRRKCLTEPTTGEYCPPVVETELCNKQPCVPTNQPECHYNTDCEGLTDPATCKPDVCSAELTCMKSSAVLEADAGLYHAMYFSTAGTNSPIGKYREFRFIDDKGFFTYDKKTDRSEARLWGYLRNFKNGRELSPATGDEAKIIRVDFFFKGTRHNLPGDGGVKTGGGPKRADWRYYDMVTGRIEVIQGTNAGAVFEARHKSGTPLMQVGIGANDKDLDLGASSWFEWRNIKSTGAWAHADINIDISKCNLDDTPDCTKNLDCLTDGDAPSCAPPVCDIDTDSCAVDVATKVLKVNDAVTARTNTYSFWFSRTGSPPVGNYQQWRFTNQHGYFTYDVAVDRSQARVWGTIEPYRTPKTGTIVTGSDYKKVQVEILFENTCDNHPVNGFCGEKKADWRFYNIKKGYMKVIAGKNKGMVFEIRNRPTKPVMQLGSGANLLDHDLGFSVWFQYRIVPEAEHAYVMDLTVPDTPKMPCGPISPPDDKNHKWFYGDINVDISTCNDAPECHYNTDCRAPNDPDTCSPQQCSKDTHTCEAGPTTHRARRAQIASSFHALWNSKASSSSALGKYNSFRFLNEKGYVTYEMTEGGYARIWGFLENYKSKYVKATGNDRKLIAIDFKFKGTPGNQPDRSGVKTGGGSKKSDWRYYELESGHIEILEGTNAGTMIEARHPAGTPYLQIGDGANDKDSSFGGSTWYEWRVKGTGAWTKGDINIDILPCIECEYNIDCFSADDKHTCSPLQCSADTKTCAAGPAVKTLRRAQITDHSWHALYNSKPSSSSPLGKYNSYRFVDSKGFITYETTEGGEGRVWGYLENYKSKNSKATGNDRKVIAIDFKFKGTPGNQPAAAGVKTGGGAKRSDWRYYELMSGVIEVIEGTNAGTKIEVQQEPNSPWLQIGHGANDKDSSFGLSDWFQWRVVGTTSWTKADINMDILNCR